MPRQSVWLRRLMNYFDDIRRRKADPKIGKNGCCCKEWPLDHKTFIQKRHFSPDCPVHGNSALKKKGY